MHKKRHSYILTYIDVFKLHIIVHTGNVNLQINFKYCSDPE